MVNCGARQDDTRSKAGSGVPEAAAAATSSPTNVRSVHSSGLPFQRMVQPRAARTLRTQSLSRPHGIPMRKVASAAITVTGLA